MIAPSTKRKLKDIHVELVKVNAYLAGLAANGWTDSDSVEKAVREFDRQIKRIYDIIEKRGTYRK